MDIHEDVAEYIAKVLEEKTYPEQAYKSCSGILSFSRRVGNERLIDACRCAQSFGQYGYRVLYASTAKLKGQLKLAKAKGTNLTELKRIERTDLLILDDFGLHPFDSQARVTL